MKDCVFPSPETKHVAVTWLSNIKSRHEGRYGIIT